MLPLFAFHNFVCKNYYLTIDQAPYQPTKNTLGIVAAEYTQYNVPQEGKLYKYSLTTIKFLRGDL